MNTWDSIIKDYQTLIAGVLAIIAAIIAYAGAIKAARAQAKAALASADAQINHSKKLEEDTLRRRRVAFTIALQLAAFRVKNQVHGLLFLINDNQSTRETRHGIIDQYKIFVPLILRSGWEDMALLEERLQAKTEDLVMAIERINSGIDQWKEFYELNSTEAQEDMKDLELSLNENLKGAEGAAQQLMEELQDWIDKPNTVGQPDQLLSGDEQGPRIDRTRTVERLS